MKTADEVLAAYENCHPDWIVMDVEMKRIDGITATANLMAHDPSAKVIIVTKYDDADTRQAASQAGAVSFLGKDDLIALRSILQTARITMRRKQEPRPTY